ncbi:MAG: hypothetical protein L0Z50_18560, partial [Verrucomicrobiales bacterium]|nr:hypothetical protein [Verrucomicrobiales bacterium]
FWSTARVQEDSLYQQFAVVFNPKQYSMQPFPNWFTSGQKQTMSGGVCDFLKKALPNYSCKGATAGVSADGVP